MKAKVAVRDLPLTVLPEPVQFGVEIKATGATWPHDLQVEWEERAAINKLIGRELRKKAERLAFTELDPDLTPSGTTSRSTH